MFFILENKKNAITNVGDHRHYMSKHMYTTVKSLNRIHKSHKKTKHLLLSLAEYVEIYVLFDRSEQIPDLESGERN